MHQHHILIVDDDQDIRQLLNHHLKKSGMLPYQAATGKEAIQLLEQQKIDLIILDLMMDEMDGWEVLEQLKVSQLQIPVIVLSARQLISDKIETLGLGADDYMTKPFSPGELIARVQVQLRRFHRTVLSQEITAGNFTYNNSTYQLQKPDGNVSLSPLEGAMLELFMRSPGRVFTKEELFKEVWKLDQFDANLVNVYINYLRRKLEDNPSKPRYIQTIWGIGYRFTGTK